MSTSTSTRARSGSLPIPSPPTSHHGPTVPNSRCGTDEQRDTLEKASAENPNRSAVEQKIGDYYASCMDEGAIDAKGVKAIESEIARISALKDKKQLAEEVAHLHQITFALLPGSNSGRRHHYSDLDKGRTWMMLRRLLHPRTRAA